MNSPHPALVRAFVQTSGPELMPSHAVMRTYLDRVSSVDWIGCGAYKMLDHDGRQVGIVQFQPPWADEVDDRVETIVRAAVAGLQPPPDILAGDTVIRPLDPASAADATIAKAAAASGGKVDVRSLWAEDPRLGTIQRPEMPPPLELADYQPPEAEASDYDWTNRQGVIWATILVVAAIVSFIAAYLTGANH